MGFTPAVVAIALLLITFAESAVGQETHPRTFRPTGWIMNGIGKECHYKQTYKRDDKHFMKSEFRDVTGQEVRIIRFDNAKCMATMLRSSDRPEDAAFNEHVNVTMIADEIVRQMTGANGYFRKNADFDTRTYYEPQVTHGRGMCIKSKRYSFVAIAVEFFSDGNNITGAAYSPAIECEKEVAWKRFSSRLPIVDLPLSDGLKSR